MKNFYWKYAIGAIGLFLILQYPAAAQQSQTSQEQQDKKVIEVQPFSEFLSDPELAKYQIQTMNFGLPPGGIDSIAHKHDCDILVIVMDGSVELTQGSAKPFTLRTGQVFLEKANIVHSVTRNPDPHHPLRMLLIYVLKEGRQSYTRLDQK